MAEDERIEQMYNDAFYNRHNREKEVGLYEDKPAYSYGSSRYTTSPGSRKRYTSPRGTRKPDKKDYSDIIEVIGIIVSVLGLLLCLLLT